MVDNASELLLRTQRIIRMQTFSDSPIMLLKFQQVARLCLLSLFQESQLPAAEV